MCGLLKKIEERGEFESNNKERAHFFLLIIHQNSKNKNCKRTQCEPLEADALSHRQDEREKNTWKSAREVWRPPQKSMEWWSAEHSSSFVYYVRWSKILELNETDEKSFAIFCSVNYSVHQKANDSSVIWPPNNHFNFEDFVVRKPKSSDDQFVIQTDWLNLEWI